MADLREYFKNINFEPKQAPLGFLENHFLIEVKRNTFPNSKLEFESKDKHVLTYQNNQGLYEVALVLDFEFDEYLINPSSVKDPEIQELTQENPELLRRYDSFQIGDETFYELSPLAVEALIKTPVITLKPHADNLYWCLNLIRCFLSSDDSLPPLFENNL